ncbi:hypothetical protein [Nibribacter ruber]|uniref:hypothetical protein n=1 Tax=Nibribacter ruber TaxID=2698458 RepID=UPI001E39BDD8|nr:hypothetical protein [Nibribacter ruber]
MEDKVEQEQRQVGADLVEVAVPHMIMLSALAAEAVTVEVRVVLLLDQVMNMRTVLAEVHTMLA